MNKGSGLLKRSKWFAGRLRGSSRFKVQGSKYLMLNP
jgi:hypothetical protein